MANELIFAEERQSRMLSMLKTRNKLLVNELCEFFLVSPATIRNDLNDLEKRGLLKRTHGGAIPGTKIGFEPTAVQKQITNRSEKQLIAERAALLIENGDTIALDTGTTTYCLAEKLSECRDVTVVTADIRIAVLLESFEGVSVILAGGKVRRGFGCTMGAFTNQALSSLHVDKVFLATNSLNPFGELCTPDIEQSQVKRSLIQMGAQVILLMDSTKFGLHSFAKFGTVADIDLIITDSGVDNDVLNDLSEKGIDVEVADE